MASQDPIYERVPSLHLAQPEEDPVLKKKEELETGLSPHPCPQACSHPLLFPYERDTRHSGRTQVGTVMIGKKTAYLST